MNDPDRIDAICELLRRAWQATPHHRLGQLIVCLSNNPNPLTEAMLWNVSDKDLAAAIVDWVEKYAPDEDDGG